MRLEEDDVIRADVIQQLMCHDAVDVEAGPDGGVSVKQSVFAGSYTVTSMVTKGTPVITVKPNSAAVSIRLR